jgi:hypothetical protein
MRKGGWLHVERNGKLARVLACPMCLGASLRIKLTGGTCIECTRAAAVVCLACAVVHRQRVAAAKAKRKHDRTPLVRYVRGAVDSEPSAPD